MSYTFEPLNISIDKRTRPKFGLLFTVSTSSGCTESYGLFIQLSITIIYNLRIYITPLGSVKWVN